MKTELYLWGLKKGRGNILAYTIEMGKTILWNGRWKWRELSYTKIYGMYMAAMALAKWRA